MNQWTKNRIKELAEQRKAELQKFYEDQWTSGDGEVEAEKQKYIDGWVANDLECDTEGIRNQAWQGYEKLCEED